MTNEAQWRPTATNFDRYEAEFRRLHDEEINTWTGDGPAPRRQND